MDKPTLLLIDQQTLDHLLAGVRALQILHDQPGSWSPFELIEDEVMSKDQLDTLAENLNTSFFEPNQAEVLDHFYDPQYDHLIKRAEDRYASDEIEIDDKPIFSPAENGTWVSAWLWVEHEDV